MKYLAALILLTLISCAPQFNINRAKHHQQKAIDKGAVLTTSTDTLYVNDTTIVETISTINDTVYIESVKTITVEKIVYQKGEIRYITKKDKRIEKRQAKVDSKREFKLDIAKVKADVKKNKKPNYWLIILIVSLAIVAVAYVRKRL